MKKFWLKTNGNDFQLKSNTMTLTFSNARATLSSTEWNYIGVSFTNTDFDNDGYFCLHVENTGGAEDSECQELLNTDIDEYTDTSASYKLVVGN